MSSASRYALFQARYGVVLTIGVILTYFASQNSTPLYAVAVGVATAVISLAVYLKYDRPKVRELARQGG